MFGVDSTELVIIALAALIFIGPKELPGAMRTLGRFLGKMRSHARHFTAGIENMMREAELEEMEKRWREENERIMREHPVALPYPGAAEELGGPAPDGDGSAPAKVNQQDSPASRQPGAAGDEPPLPLPEPDHHRRELP